MDQGILEIPDEALCRQLMNRYSMLPNIVRHSYRVCQIACLLARELNRQGALLNYQLIVAASLLHDITKTRSLETKENHSETGRNLLLGLGCPKVADIVARHVRLGLDNDEEGSINTISEAHIVNYSDKRVRHDQVVTVQERFEDLKARYARTPAHLVLMRERLAVYLDLERRIFDHIAIGPASSEIMGLGAAVNL